MEEKLKSLAINIENVCEVFEKYKKAKGEKKIAKERPLELEILKLQEQLEIIENIIIEIKSDEIKNHLTISDLQMQIERLKAINI